MRLEVFTYDSEWLHRSGIRLNKLCIMNVVYKNRKNVIYTLFQAKTKTGKWRYFFAKSSSKNTPCDSIPKGYEISESINGIVSLIKSRPMLILDNEKKFVRALLDKHPQTSKYRIFVRYNCIDIYELVGSSANDLISIFQAEGLGSSTIYEKCKDEQELHGQYTPVLRFFIQDEEKRLFRAERMCFLGSIDDWIAVGATDKLGFLAIDMIPRLGSEAFFELY